MGILREAFKSTKTFTPSWKGARREYRSGYEGVRSTARFWVDFPAQIQIQDGSEHLLEEMKRLDLENKVIPMVEFFMKNSTNFNTGTKPASGFRQATPDEVRVIKSFCATINIKLSENPEAFVYEVRRLSPEGFTVSQWLTYEEWRAQS